MKKNETIASHQGTVTTVKRGSVSVQIQSLSACAACQAHDKCGFAESKNKTLEIPTPDWQRYREGQTVTVHISQGRALKAVWIAYLLPALLLIAIAIALSLAGLKESTVILATFGSLAAYILALFLLRKRINNQFTLSLC